MRQRQRERQRIIHIIIFCKVLVNTKLLLLGEIQDMVPASFRSQHSPQPINTQPCFMPISVEYLILMLIYWHWAHGQQHWISYLKGANLHKAYGSLPALRNTRQYISTTTILNSRSTNFKEKNHKMCRCGPKHNPYRATVHSVRNKRASIPLFNPSWEQGQLKIPQHVCKVLWKCHEYWFLRLQIPSRF